MRPARDRPLDCRQGPADRDRVVLVRGAGAKRPDRARGFLNDAAAASRPGEEGVGEQVGLADAQESLRASDFPLIGTWATLAEFLAHLDAIEMWPEPPEYELQRN